MTPDQFLEWLDKEIQENKLTLPYLHLDQIIGFAKGKIIALEQVKEKFLTLTPPPIKK